jgi:large subunit ribosomal protein L3
VGDLVKVDVFAVGAFVDVIGTSKGRGFTGTIKRHNFQRGPKTHGCMNYRQPGSIGTKRTGKLFPGKRMSGHFGDERTTTKNMRVVRVDADRNLLFVKGAIAGPNGGLVQVLTAKTAPAPKQVQVGKAGKAAGGKR